MFKFYKHFGKRIEKNLFNDKKSLAKREDLLLELINKAKLGMVIVDQSHYVVEANQRFADMLGYTLDEVLNMHTWDWELETQKEQIRSEYADLSAIDMSIETRHRRKDGTVINVEVNGTGINLGGRADNNAILCFCQDITERKKTERLLLESEKRYRSFVENAADIIFTIDTDFNVRYMSPNCERITGFHPDELEGKKLLDFIEPNDTSSFLSDVRAAFAGEFRYLYEYRFMHKDKSIEWYSIRFSELTDEGETMLICNARNINLKKEYEKKLEYLSMHDQLTGVYNRAYFNEEIIRRDQLNIYPLSIISCDVDGLKKVNDSMGHAAGDELLRSCARLISSSLRNADTFARTGGDEFAIILPETSFADASGLAKRIKCKIENYNENSNLPPLSISCGIATKENLNDSIDKILKEADRRMYEQKRERLKENIREGSE